MDNSILHKEYTVVQNDYTNAGKVSSDIKTTLNEIGISPKIIRKVAVASYECEINQIIHAFGGKVYLDVSEDGRIVLVFKDPGPGIPDINAALTPGWSTASEQARGMGFGAGMGLPNIQRVSDEFDIQSSKEGTTVTIGFKAQL